MAQRQGSQGLDAAVLPIVLPATHRLVYVHDTALRGNLAQDGACTDPAEADVVVTPVGRHPWLRHPSCACMIVTLADGSENRRHPQAWAVLRRALRYVRTAFGAWRQGRMLRGRGYQTVDVITWDIGQRLALGSSVGGRRLAERLPTRAVVAAYVGQRPRRLLDAIVAEAADASGHRIDLARAWAKSGVLVAISETVVLRVALGDGAERVQGAKAVLEELRSASLPGRLGDVIPTIWASGETSSAVWTVESRLPGRAPGSPVTPQLRWECVGILVDLHGSARRRDLDPPLLDWAATVAPHCDPPTAKAIRLLASRATADLVGAPAGFGHGDFTPGNLLTDGGALLGVIDWEGGGPGHVAGLDLLHLFVRDRRARGSHRWGEALLGLLTDWEKDGLPAEVASYAERVGLRLDTTRCRSLFVAYWLQRLHYQLDRFAARRATPIWLQRNVYAVADRFHPLLDAPGS